MRKPRVLVDCDGVLADFLASALQVVEKLTGTKYTKDHILTWEMFDHVPREIEQDCYAEWGRQHFCGSLMVIPGAQNGMTKLNEISDLFIVTSPMHTPTWVFERTSWLKEHFGISKKKIIHCSCKYVVTGDVLIDDKIDNIREWLAHHPEGLGILWEANYNKNETLLPNMVRTNNWDDAIMFIERHAEGLR